MRCLLLLLVLLVPTSVVARDRGQYAATSPEMKDWFDKLHSEKGPCCSDADGAALSDTEWESVNDPNKPNVHYRVFIEKKWWDVTDDALITVPNRVGRVMVWPIYSRGFGVASDLSITIRCFMPGALI